MADDKPSNQHSPESNKRFNDLLESMGALNYWFGHKKNDIKNWKAAVHKMWDGLAEERVPAELAAMLGTLQPYSQYREKIKSDMAEQLKALDEGLK